MIRGDILVLEKSPSISPSTNKSIFNPNSSKGKLPSIQSQFSVLRKKSVPEIEEMIKLLPNPSKTNEFLEFKRKRQERNLTNLTTKSTDMTSSFDYTKLNENSNNKSSFHKMTIKKKNEGFRKSSSMTNQLSLISAALNISSKTV